mgnify:CR=1 FL=1
MQEELVKLAEEKEYNKFHPLWFENNIIEPKSWFIELCLLQKWIRDTHNIHIEIYANAGGWGWILTKCAGSGSTIKDIEDYNFFDTYEEALEDGLIKALNLIPNNK